MNVRIEFDGGTSCNIPRLGYGNGYGSYRVNNEPVHRCSFNRPMSANAAEIFTLAYAIGAVRDRGDAVRTTLNIIGDSRIALRWAAKSFSAPHLKVAEKTSPGFQEAIWKLQDCIRAFAAVNTTWQPRLKSVATFGH